MEVKKTDSETVLQVQKSRIQQLYEFIAIPIGERFLDAGVIRGRAGQRQRELLAVPHFGKKFNIILLHPPVFDLIDQIQTVGQSYIGERGCSDKRKQEKWNSHFPFDAGVTDRRSKT